MTDRDRSVLRALVHAVRVFSVDQVGRGWWLDVADSARAARGRLRRLEAADLVELERVNFRAREASEPLAHWSPGAPEPELGALRYRAVKRAEEGVPRWGTLVRGTARAAALLAGVEPQLRDSLQLEHDLTTSEVFLRYRSSSPELAARWQTEDLAPAGEKRGDATILDGEGRPFRVIEVAGLYSTRQLRSSWDHARAHGLEWELW